MTYSPYGPEPPIEVAPAVVLWARVYNSLLALTYLGVAGLGVVVLVAGISVGAPRDALPTSFMGALYLVLGIAFAIPSIWAAVSGRKKYAWYLNMIMICLGLTSCACLPFCVPLLIFWLKPEVKAWYGA